MKKNLFVLKFIAALTSIVLLFASVPGQVFAIDLVVGQEQENTVENDGEGLTWEWQEFPGGPQILVVLSAATLRIPAFRSCWSAGLPGAHFARYSECMESVRPGMKENR